MQACFRKWVLEHSPLEEWSRGFTLTESQVFVEEGLRWFNLIVHSKFTHSQRVCLWVGSALSGLVKHRAFHTLTIGWKLAQWSLKWCHRVTSWQWSLLATRLVLFQETHSRLSAPFLTHLLLEVEAQKEKEACELDVVTIPRSLLARKPELAFHLTSHLLISTLDRLLKICFSLTSTAKRELSQLNSTDSSNLAWCTNKAAVSEQALLH